MTLVAVSAAILVIVAGTAYLARSGPRHEAANRRLHRGATAREVEADARLRYYTHRAADDEIAERCARLEHHTGRAS